MDAENFLPAYKEESDNMKKKCIMALIIGAAFLAQGCGYEEGTDAVVTVVDSTPTPEPTEKPKATATPTPEAAVADSTADGTAAAADSTADGAAAATDPAAQTAATEQTPSGINVQAQDATYYAVEGVNLRSDANAEAEFVAGVLSGEALKCTVSVTMDGFVWIIMARPATHPVIMSAQHRRWAQWQQILPQQILPQKQHSRAQTTGFDQIREILILL